MKFLPGTGKTLNKNETKDNETKEEKIRKKRREEKKKKV